MMKQRICRPLVLALAGALALTGCFGRGNGSSSSASPAPSASAASSGAGTSYAAGGTGLALTAKTSGMDPFDGEAGYAQADVTATAVLLDGEGRIADCIIDMVQAKLPVDDSGQLGFTAADAFPTKRELGDDYGLRQASGIGREWDEQVEAFCAYVKGKTPMEVAGIAAPGGHAADPDLAAGCTIDISEFQQGVLAACENAVPMGASPEDTLTLGLVPRADGMAATAQQAGTARATTTVAALTLNSEDRITSARLDETEAGFGLSAAGALSYPAALLSKYAQGDAYGADSLLGSGMADGSASSGPAADGAGSWYRQADAFGRWLNGRTADEVSALRLDEQGRPTDQDILAGTAMPIENFVKAIQKACENADKPVN